MEKPTAESLLDLLREVAEDWDDTGCVGMGTVSLPVINKVLLVLGRNPIPVEDEDDDFDKMVELYEAGEPLDRCDFDE